MGAARVRSARRADRDRHRPGTATAEQAGGYQRDARTPLPEHDPDLAVRRYRGPVAPVDHEIGGLPEPVDERDRATRVHFFHRRRKHQICAFRFQQLPIPFECARVFRKVFIRLYMYE